MTDHLPAGVLFPLDRPPTRTAFEVWVWVKGVEWDVAQYYHPPNVFATDMLTKAVREICADGYGLRIPPDLVPIYVPKFLAEYRRLRELASGLQGPAVSYIDATIAWFEHHYPLPPAEPLIVGEPAGFFERHFRALALRLDKWQVRLRTWWHHRSTRR